MMYNPKKVKLTDKINVEILKYDNKVEYISDVYFIEMFYYKDMKEKFVKKLHLNDDEKKYLLDNWSEICIKGLKNMI